MSQRALVTRDLIIALMLVAFGVVTGITIPRAHAAAQDEWEGVAPSVWSPAEYFDPVTPSDTTDLPYVSRGLYSHDGGEIACRGKNGVSRVFLFAAGEIKPIRCWRVLSTGTTSTDISSMR